jgi:hypothetical protein
MELVTLLDCSALNNETNVENVIIFFSFGAIAPSGSGPSHLRVFYVTHNDAPQLVGLLWKRDLLVAETTDRQTCPGGTRTHNLSRRAAADLGLTLRGHWVPSLINLLECNW